VSVRIDIEKLLVATRVARPLFFDDFLRAVLGDAWITEVTGTGSLGIQDMASGVCRLATGTTSGSTAAIFNGGAAYLLYDPAIGILFEERIRLPGALTDLEAFFGLSTLDGLNHIMWTARPAIVGNFRCESMVGGTTYAFDSGVPLDNEWHRLRIEVEAAEVRFYIDGELVWTTTNVPTTRQCIELYIENTVAASRELDIDWVYAVQRGR